MKIHEVSRSRARREILDFLQKREKEWASVIADSLRLDLSLVNTILQELQRERRVDPVPRRAETKPRSRLAVRG